MTTQTPVRPVPAEKVTPIKPSEAIRLGCLIAPRQIAGDFFGPDGRACAIGAARIGWGEPYSAAVYRHLVRLDLSQLSCPACPGNDFGSYDASWVISHLNDIHLWPRERIADWLAEQGL